MALTKDRSTPSRDGTHVRYPVKGGVSIFAGALVVHAANGFAEPGKTATGLIPLGRAEGPIDNTDGANGDAFVLVKRGCLFRFDNLATDLVPASQIGRDCYIVDDATVAASDRPAGAQNATRSVAGKVIDVDDAGVWVAL